MEKVRASSEQWQACKASFYGSYRFFSPGLSHVSAAWNFYPILQKNKNELKKPRMFFVTDVFTLEVFCVKIHDSADCGVVVLDNLSFYLLGLQN